MIPVLGNASKSRIAAGSSSGSGNAADADAPLARVTSAAIRSAVLRLRSQAGRLQYGLIIDPAP